MTQQFASRGFPACLLACALPLALLAASPLINVHTARADASSAASALAAPADAKHQAQVDAVVKAYLGLQQQLADDKADGLGAQFAKLREAAKPLTAADDAKVKEQAKTVVEHATKEPKTLQEARASFKPLSSGVIGLVNLVPPTAAAAPALYEATCPMVKANWLQTSKDIVNPYMGQQMRGCGSIERKIESSGAEKRSAAAHEQHVAPLTGSAASPVSGVCCGVSRTATTCR